MSGSLRRWDDVRRNGSSLPASHDVVPTLLLRTAKTAQRGIVAYLFSISLVDTPQYQGVVKGQADDNCDVSVGGTLCFSDPKF
jgi:hypothetical protein